MSIIPALQGLKVGQLEVRGQQFFGSRLGPRFQRVYTAQLHVLSGLKEPSFPVILKKDFQECAEEGHFKGQISQKWTNSAKFHVFSSPLLTKMSVFTPKMRDERGMFPKDSLLFASIPAGEGCKSPIEGREEIRVVY